MEDNHLDFFPYAKRSPEAFSEHFTKACIAPLVEYNEKKIFEVKLKEMKSALTTQIAEEADISEVIESVKQHVKDAKLPDIEVVRILWDVIMDAVQWSRKNQQQNANLALRQVFKKFGVEKYDPINEQFDPHRHNAVFQVPDPTTKDFAGDCELVVMIAKCQSTCLCCTRSLICNGMWKID